MTLLTLTAGAAAGSAATWLLRDAADWAWVQLQQLGEPVGDLPEEWL